MHPQLRILEPFLGKWVGSGQGTFPGIQPFHYEECFLLSLDGNGERIYFEEKAYRTSTDQLSDNRFHSELGSIRIVGNSLEAVLVHASGRVEILDLLQNQEGQGLLWKSKRIENDIRMPQGCESLRAWNIENGVLQYSFAMSTARVPQPTAHLRGSLKKQSNL